MEKFTIVWYLENLKVLHMDTEVGRNILNLIASKFEGYLELTISTNHVCMGIDITFTYEDIVDIGME